MKIVKSRAISPALSPLYELGQIENRIRRLFEEPFEFLTSTPTFTPPVEVREFDNEYVVTAELPGMTKDNVDIEYQNGVLTLKGEKSEEKREEERNVLVWERQYGSFQRSFMLPNTIDQDKITAEFKDGVLKVVLPKVEAAKGRKINIVSEVK